MELDDYVELVAKLKECKSEPVPQTSFNVVPGVVSSSPQLNRPTSLSSSQSGVSNTTGVTGQLLGHVGTGSKARIIVGGATTGTTHPINEEERAEFTKHINSVLAGDPLVGSLLPFPTDTFQIFDECRDGLVLSQLINDSVPDTIDIRVLNIPKPGKTLNNF